MVYLRWLVNWLNISSRCIYSFSFVTFFNAISGIIVLAFWQDTFSKKAKIEYKKSNNLNSDYDDKFLTASGTIKFLANFCWLPFGIILSCCHLISGLLNFFGCVLLITIPICLPNALAHFKMVRVALAPFGIRLIRTDLANDILKQVAKSQL